MASAGGFAVRDSREGFFLWIDKQVMAYISQTFGNSALVVYTWLCYYANAKDQGCYPSFSTLANHTNLSRRSVIRIINKLDRAKLISIEREEGRANIYKLLQVEHSILWKSGSDMDVTGDTVAPGVGAVVSPPVVTPGNLEQDRIEQDIFNKTAVSFLSLWKTSVLPYPLPTEQVVGELIGVCQALLVEVNLFKFILDYKTDKGYPPSPAVLLKICQQFKDSKGQITNAYGWFKRSVDAQMRQFFADISVHEHEAIKQEPSSLGQIMQEIASRGS